MSKYLLGWLLGVPDSTSESPLRYFGERRTRPVDLFHEQAPRRDRQVRKAPKNWIPAAAAAPANRLQSSRRQRSRLQPIMPSSSKVLPITAYLHSYYEGNEYPCSTLRSHLPSRGPRRGLDVSQFCATALGNGLTPDGESADRKGLERLLRYCARPIFASERLAWTVAGERVVYSLPKPAPLGQMRLLTPIAFLERVATLIPPPRRHRHRYHGVLAPNAPLRAGVTARAGLPIEGSVKGPLTQWPSKQKSRSARAPLEGSCGPCCWHGSMKCSPSRAPLW